MEIEVDDPGAAFGQPAGSQTRPGSVSYSGGSGAVGALGTAAGSQYVADYEDEEAEPLPHVEQRVLQADEQTGRNDPCWCGSGKKFKKCHGA